MSRIEHNDDVYRTTWWIEEDGTVFFETGTYVVRSLDGQTAACELMSKEGENGVQYTVSTLFMTKQESMAQAMSEAIKSKYDITSGLDHLDYLSEQYPERFV